MTKKKILIATGGTGGHIFPAYSLAKYFINKNYDITLSTDKRGFQYLKNYEDFNIIKINSSPLVKKIFLLLFFLHSKLLFQLLNLFISCNKKT